MYLFKPFIHTWQVILMMAWKNSYFVSFLILSQAYVTPVLQFHETQEELKAKFLAKKITFAMLSFDIRIGRITKIGSFSDPLHDCWLNYLWSLHSKIFQRLKIPNDGWVHAMIRYAKTFIMEYSFLKNAISCFISLFRISSNYRYKHIHSLS